MRQAQGLPGSLCGLEIQVPQYKVGLLVQGIPQAQNAVEEGGGDIGLNQGKFLVVWV